MTVAGTLRGWLVLGLALAVAGECPLGYVHLGYECYYFGTEQLTRDDALNYCITIGANLSSFSDCGQFTAVSRYLGITEMNANGQAYWVGASRSGDVWTWMDSSDAFPYGAPYWDPTVRVESELDTCAVIQETGGYLQPSECMILNRPMCEAPLPPTSHFSNPAPPSAEKPRITCPDPFVPLADRCFYINDVFLNWQDAREACTLINPDHFSDLAVLSDCEVFSAVARYMEAKQEADGRPDWLWVGARDPDKNGHYQWLNGDYADPGVPFWAPGQPNDFEEKQECAMLWGTNYFYGNDEDCTKIFKSICEIGF